MIETTVFINPVETAKSTGFWVQSTKDTSGNPGLQHQAGAHQTGFQRYIDRTVTETPAPKSTGCFL